MSAALRAGYKQTAVGVIPEDWEVRPLFRVADIRGGIAKNANTTISDPISVHYLRVANVQDGFLSLGEMSKIELSRGDLGRFRVLPGDVLMNEGGDLDKLGRGAIWHGDFDPCVHQNHVFVVRCKAGLLPEYLNIWTATPPARRFFLVAGKQTTNLASISKSSLGELPVAIPCLPEQRAIAAALSDVDALLAGLDRLIAKKRDLKQAAMQQLLTGQTRLPGFQGEWEVKKLGELGSTYGGLTGKSKNDFGSGTAKYVTFMNVMNNTVIDESLFEPVRVTASESQNQVKHGDLLFNGSSETPEEVALCSLMTSEPIDLYLNSFCFGFRASGEKRFDGLFLTFYIRSSEGREIMKSLAQGSTRHNISKKALLAAEVRLPTLAEQTAIATVLSDMDAELTALEARRDKTRGLKQAMMQELLTGRIRLV